MTVQSANTTMRMLYCASELGYQLQTVDPVAATYTLVKDKDRKTVHATGVAASAVAIKTALSVVDPTIVSAV
jgi:hypothetical protein